MCRLDEPRLLQAISEMEHAGDIARPNYNQNWDEWYQLWGVRDAVLEFPLGELTNPGIAGFVWAWNLKGMINVLGIHASDKFNAQGLEGKVQIKTQFSTALLAARELPAYRRAVDV